MKKSAVIFDIDGLLINSEPLWNKAASEIFRQYGILLTEQQYALTTGLRSKEFVAHWLYEHKIPSSEYDRAEQRIIEELLQRKKAAIFWDIDAQFLTNEEHAAGHFIRKYKNEWKYYQENPFEWQHNHFSESKSIQIIGTPKNVGQSKQVGAILNQCITEKINMSRTAVVLGNEALLQPTLHSIPAAVPSTNITMGLPLTNASLSTFFDQLITRTFKIIDNQRKSQICS